MLFACALTGRVIGLTIEVHWLTGPACRNRSTDCHAARSIGVDRWFQYFVWRAVGDTPLGPQLDTPQFGRAVGQGRVPSHCGGTGCLAIRRISSRRRYGGPQRAAESTCRLCSPGGTWPRRFMRGC